MFFKHTNKLWLKKKIVSVIEVGKRSPSDDWKVPALKEGVWEECKHMRTSVCGAGCVRCFGASVREKKSQHHSVAKRSPLKGFHPYKALQMEAGRRNRQQSHYCGTTGDKAPFTQQGSWVAFFADISKWKTHRSDSLSWCYCRLYTQSTHTKRWGGRH